MRSTPSNLWKRRHLLWVLVVSNLKRQNKSSSLGYLWWLIDPLIMTAIYYVVVTIVFDRGGSNQPFILFLVCGLLPWKAFAESLGQSTRAFKGAAGIIKAISFPKAVLPMSLVASNTIYLTFALIVPIALALFFGASHDTWPTLHYLLIPYIVLTQALLALGVSFLLATLGVFFIDLQNMIRHITRMLYFMSPGLYSIERIPEAWQSLYRLNPLAGILTSYRDIIMHGRVPLAIDLIYPFAFALFILLVGYISVRSFEGRLAQHI